MRNKRILTLLLSGLLLFPQMNVCGEELIGGGEQTDVLFSGEEPKYDEEQGDHEGEEAENTEEALGLVAEDNNTGQEDIFGGYDEEIELVGDTSGKSGDNISWTFANGTLTITGSGEIGNSISSDLKAKNIDSYKVNTVIIQYGITSIGDYTFSGFTNLVNVILPDSINNIGWSAFEGCTSLISINIPYGVTSLNNTFYQCSSLTNVDIPDSVTTLFSTFNSCTNLNNISIPNSVTCIDDGTFAFCSKLTSVTIPHNVTDIGGAVFWGCTSVLTR